MLGAIFTESTYAKYGELVTRNVSVHWAGIAVCSMSNFETVLLLDGNISLNEVNCESGSSEPH